MIDFQFDLQLFGGGGKNDTNTQSSTYTPSAQEQQLMNYAVSNAGDAQTAISSLLKQYTNGVNSSDFQNILGNANNLISSGQSLYSSLANGELPSAYTQNMTDAIKSTLTNTVGSTVNSLANRGVLNSSVTNKALNDIDTNASNAVAQSYNNNINTLANLAGNQISSATAGYSPYSALASLAGTTQNNFVTSPLSAMHNGTTSTTNGTDSGWGSTLGTALKVASLFA